MRKLTLFILFTLGSVSTYSFANKLPNMLVFIADDLGYLDTEVAGSKDARTPNIAKLAREGMNFTNAFVNSPSCAPSRAALFTALRSARNGIQANHEKVLAPNVTHVLGPFKKLGYEIAAFGKVSHGKGQWDHGFDYQGSTNLSRKEIKSYLAERDEKRPLILFVGSRPPHVPWPHNSSFNPNKLDLPAKSVDTPQTRINFSQYLEDVATMDNSLGEVRKLSKQYLGTNTITVFTSDHGAQWPYGKWNLYDAGVKVPLIISWPDKVKKRSESKALVSWIDIIPTLSEMVGTRVTKQVDGLSFKRVLLGKSSVHRDKVFLTHTGDPDQNVFPIRAVRTAKFKYIKNLHPELLHRTHQLKNVYMEHNKLWPTWLEAARNGDVKARKSVAGLLSRTPEELYDIENDPDETQNLYQDPRYKDTLESLRAALKREMIASADEELLKGTPIRLVDCFIDGCELSVYQKPPPKNAKN